MSSKKFGGKKFERKKVRLFRRCELFSAQTFLLDSIYPFQIIFGAKNSLHGFPKVWKPEGIRKKVRAEKSSNCRKSRTFFLSNFFPQNFFWFIWKQRCYSNGRPLILKLVPNDEEWNDKEAQFNWIWQRKLVLKCNVTILKTIINVPNKLGLSCAKLRLA